MKSTEELTRRLDKLKHALERSELRQVDIDQIELELEKLSDLVSRAPQKERSLRELKGLGKEIWRSIDVDEYLREERRSWR